MEHYTECDLFSNCLNKNTIKTKDFKNLNNELIIIQNSFQQVNSKDNQIKSIKSVADDALLE